MGKRANNQVAPKSVAKKPKVAPVLTSTGDKKPKVDPVLTSIGDVIKQAEDLPDRCRAMLVEMLPFSLAVPLGQRHEFQTMVVGMVEETLSSRKSSMDAAIAVEDAKLASLQSSQVELMNNIQEAEAALAAQKDVVNTKTRLLADATTSANASSKMLSDLRAEQKASAAKLEQTKAEKSALETAFEEHFLGSEGPNYKGLQPHLKNLNIESSLFIAVPASCAKPKEQRGSFDMVVLEEVEKAILSRTSALGEAVAAETLASLECEAAVHAAQEEYDAKKDTQKQAATDLDAAQKAQSDREEVLGKAKLAVDALHPQINAANGLVEMARITLGAFERGPLASFASCNTTLAAAATAGA